MGTNYYLVIPQGAKCIVCGYRPPESREHIGKSSFGRTFALHVYPEYGLSTLDDWKARWKIAAGRGGRITDEYGSVLEPDTMLREITERARECPPEAPPFDYEGNGAEPGPNGLVRRQFDGTRCIGHGDGTYDYIVGDFS